MFFYFFFTVFILLILIKLKIKIYHPLTITFFVWFCVPLIYVSFPTELYKLTSEVWPVLFLYIFSFFLGTSFYYLIFYKHNKIRYCYYENKTSLILNFVFILTIYLFFRYLILIFNGTTLYKLIVQGKIPASMKLLFYLDKISLVYFFYIVSKKSIQKKRNFLQFFFL